MLMLSAILSANNIFAQAQGTESLFRQSGKIYVVISVIAVIFIGIVICLIRIDRKLSNLEKQNNS